MAFERKSSRKKAETDAPAMEFDFVEAEQGDSVDHTVMMTHGAEADSFEHENPIEVEVLESGVAPESLDEDDAFDEELAAHSRHDGVDSTVASGSSMGWGDLLAPVVDFLVPSLFPLAVTLAGVAMLEGSLAEWKAPLAQPVVAACFWCFLIIANWAYYIICLGLIGDSVGRLAFAPPPFLMPRPDALWILKRMIPNAGLISVVLAGLFWLARS